MDNSNIMKIWGIRKRILLTNTAEIDLIHVNKNTFCSTHFHNKKCNKFVVLEGEFRIETAYGQATLLEGEEFEVYPPLVHRFFAVEDSTVIELAYVEEGIIDPKDIVRQRQGGRIINGQEVTMDEMKERGLLEL